MPIVNCNPLIAFYHLVTGIEHHCSFFSSSFISSQRTNWSMPVSKFQDVVTVDRATVPCQVIRVEKVYHPQPLCCAMTPGDARDGVLVGCPALRLLALVGEAPHFLAKGYEVSAGWFGVLVVGH